MKLFLVSTRRQGVALVMTLVAMAAFAIVMAVLTAQIVAQHQMTRQRHRQLQAEWLARAGVELAAARLLKEPRSFTEENRDLLPDAKVRIVVQITDRELYAVTAEAEVGSADEAAVVRTASVRFGRTETDGEVRLRAMPWE